MFRSKLSHERATEEVKARIQRQAILEQEEPPTIIIVLWEATLHHQVGVAETMRGQLAKLLEVSGRPGVLVHVVPSALGANLGLGGPVSLAAVTGKPDVLLTSSLIEDVVTSDIAQVRAASTTFEVVRAISVNIMESRSAVTPRCSPATPSTVRPPCSAFQLAHGRNSSQRFAYGQAQARLARTWGGLRLT